MQIVEDMFCLVVGCVRKVQWDVGMWLEFVYKLYDCFLEFMVEFVVVVLDDDWDEVNFRIFEVNLVEKFFVFIEELFDMGLIF